LQQRQSLRIGTQATKRQFTDYERMYEDLAGLKQARQNNVATAQMINPDRRIDQDHVGFGRRRGTGCNFGSLPPRLARRWALSRSINAVNAARINAERSFKPVNA
jgi:hypothetical protein